MTDPHAGDLRHLEERARDARRPQADDGLVVCDNLVRVYRTDEVEVQALQGLDLVAGEGECTALVGASGSGKSPLLSILSGLDLPTAGRARVAGHDLLALGRRERLGYRRPHRRLRMAAGRTQPVALSDSPGERGTAHEVRTRAAPPACRSCRRTARRPRCCLLS